MISYSSRHCTRPEKEDSILLGSVHSKTESSFPFKKLIIWNFEKKQRNETEEKDGVKSETKQFSLTSGCLGTPWTFFFYAWQWRSSFNHKDLPWISCEIRGGPLKNMHALQFLVEARRQFCMQRQPICSPAKIKSKNPTEEKQNSQL